MIRDDFAGPGGWDVALAALGHTATGVEMDAAACATARAAGHQRLHRTVQAARGFPHYWSDLQGYVASPPCQTFSSAGKGAGLPALDALREAVVLVSAGVLPERAVAEVRDDRLDDVLDERSVLVLEPLHVIEQHRPVWVALEQVPGALPVWEAYASRLERWGYSVATGIVHAEQHGVPQSRRRAVLVAHQGREVALPTPTHSRYHPRDPGRLDAGVAPWVSMTAALGHAPVAAVPGDTSWADRRPSPTIVGSFAPDVVAAPGWRKPGDPPRQRTPGSVRVSVAEAGVLQSFPADYPWQGSLGAQYRQVGDAIPPLLAQAILAPLVC